MRIPTTTLIEQLKQHIPRTPWDNKVSMTDAAEVENLCNKPRIHQNSFQIML